MGRLPSRNGNREERELNGIIEKLNTKSDTPQAIWKANESESKKEEKRLMRGMRMGWKESQPDGRGDRGYICLFFRRMVPVFLSRIAEESHGCLPMDRGP